MLLGLCLAGFGAYSLVMEYVFHVGHPAKLACSDWLDAPDTMWLELHNCTLDTHQVILESETGEMEALVSRVDGLSSHMYAKPPRWVAAWAPIRDEVDRSNMVRAVYRIESSDLIAFVNALEAAPVSKRADMWTDPAPLRRVVKPGVLFGKAERASGDALQHAWGSLSTPSMLTVRPGDPPESKAGLVGTLALVLGAAFIFVGARLFANSSGGPLGPTTAAQTITGVNVSDVKVELGALEELRAEERAARRSRAEDDR
ncbi:MAG: hypothetical protein ACO1OB_23235 [Archangium sp.]